MPYKVYKYRIYPNVVQREMLEKHFGCARFLYNQYVQWSNDEYEKWKNDNTYKSPNLPLVTFFKTKFEFLKEVDNAALAYARTNFDRAKKEFFKSLQGKRKGKRLGSPQFKKKNKVKFSYRTCDAHGSIRFSEDNKKFRLPKIGWVNVVKHRECIGAIKAVTVSRTKTYKYYICVMTECDEKALQYIHHHNEELKVVGLDMSLPNFCIPSEEEDDAIIKYRHLYRKEEKRIKRVHHNLSRKVKGSKNREKARKRLASLSEKIANRRTDFCIKTAMYFARKYDVVVIEDLNMQSMSRQLKLGKSVMDLGWGKFRSWLSTECLKYGTQLLIADKWFASSKLCSACGYKNILLTLSDRNWVCPECGCIHDRDRNAAYNLRNYYKNINSTVGTTGIYACGEKTSATSDNTDVASSLTETGNPFL